MFLSCGNPSEVVALTGGPTAFVARAKNLLAEGRFDLALSLIEVAANAEPNNRAVHLLRAQILQAKEGQEPSLMAKSIYRAARIDSQELLNRL